MKKCFKKTLSGILATAMLFSSVAIGPVTAQAAGFSVAAGWNETIYAEWPDSNPDSANVTVGYRPKGSTADYTYLTGDDLTYLVRAASSSGYGRVDIPGVAAGNYELKVTASDGTEYINNNIKVYAHDRSGYAHFNYSQGVGAYNNDGTPKDNAVIVYVTDENKDTVELPGYEGKTWSYTPSSGDPYTRTGVGIGNILNNNMKLVQEVTLTDNRPIIVRLVGTVTVPENLTPYNVKDPILGGAKGDNGNLAITKYARNVTIEGIGDDATVDGWGFTFSQTATCPAEAGESFEIRNLTFKNYTEDATAFQGDDAITAPIRRIWVHNNTYYPGYCANPAQSDKAEGDGAIDFKRGHNFTLAYNHFVKCHKTGLIGSSEKIVQYNSTLHHNWYESVEARQPLAAGGNIHIYNTYYDQSSSVTIDLRGAASCLAESNYFNTCSRPWNLRDSTCRLKLYNNINENQKKAGTINGTVVEASARSEEGLSDNGLTMIDGGSIANWDLNTAYFYCDASGNTQVTRLDDAADVPEVVATYAGTLKAFPITESGTVKVTVTDASGNAITDATVTASGLTFTNTGNGVYTAQAALGGEYQVTVSKEGYSNVVFNAAGFENDGDIFDKTVALQVDYDGYAVVKLTGGSNNEAVKGATVKLADGTVLADQGDGTYKSADQIATGNYTVTIADTGDYIAPTDAQAIVVKTTDAATEIHLEKYKGTVSVTLQAEADETQPLDGTNAKVFVGSTQLTSTDGLTFTGDVEVGTAYNVTVTLAGWATTSVTPAKLTASRTDTASAVAVLKYKGALYTWNYTTDTNTDNFFTISGESSWSSAGSNPQIFDGEELTAAIKMNSSATVTFEAPADGTITLVMEGTGSVDIVNATTGTTTTCNVTTGTNTFDVQAGVNTIKKNKTETHLYLVQYAIGDSVSENTTETTTGGSEVTTTGGDTPVETTTSEVVPPSGDNVINQSMTISRGLNDSYVTVNNDKNTSGAWKNDKYNSSSAPGWIEFTLGKSANVAITTGGEKVLYISKTVGDTANAVFSIPSGTTEGNADLEAGTYYIFNTSGNQTISQIVVTMDSSSDDTTETTTVTTTVETTVTTTQKAETTTETTTTEPTTQAPVSGVQISVEGVAAKAGTQVVIPVKLTGVSTLASYDVNIAFDSSNITVDSVTAGDMITDSNAAMSYTIGDGIVGVAGSNPSDTIAEGKDVLFNLVITPKTAGSYELTITVDEMYVAEGTAADVTAESGTVTVEEDVDPTGIRGDVNKDGKVDAIDAAIVLKIASGIITDTTPYDMTAADCNVENGDGSVNVLDAVWILNNQSGGSSSDETTEATTEAPVSGDLVETANAGDVAATTYSAPFAIGNFIVTADETNTVAVDANSKTIDGYSFTQRIKLGGAGTVDYRSIKFETTGAGNVVVYAASSNGTSARVMQILDASGAQVASADVPGSTATPIAKYTLAVPSAGTYYLGSTTGGLNVYFVGTDVALVAPEEIPTQAEQSSETTSESLSETSSETPSETTTSGAAAGNSWTAGDTAPDWINLNGAAASSNSYTAFSNTANGGTAFANAVSLAAGSTFTVTPQSAGTVKVYIAANNNSDGKGTVTAAYADSTDAGTYSLPNRKSTDATAFEVAVSDAQVGQAITFTNSYNAFLFKVEN
ncbi:MAG: cohesin domain-containing protein [Clostridia bacterium]|nr:cohesin domain-containing protein [Clostridia bacterium]